MPKSSQGYISNFERAVERSLAGLCPATAIKRIKRLAYEVYKHPSQCKDYLSTKIDTLKSICIKRQICPNCNSKLAFVRDKSKDEYCFFLGELEIRKFGGYYTCPKCKESFDID